MLGEQDDSVSLSRNDHRTNLVGGHRVELGFIDQQGIAMTAGNRTNTFHDFGEKRIPDRRQDHHDDVGFSASKTLRQGIRAEARIQDGGLHFVTGDLPDALRLIDAA